ncbi:hypothetical protein IFM89_005587 [Coptis chinensis]|uniref:Uncharacterized protein n=1 Tax=Coptis chinensis TaxID=261450 RepID=A0A835IC30_9MAGN|nr:hypothetical protein IFM89_005587 [Coptis chinensis]
MIPGDSGEIQTQHCFAAGYLLLHFTGATAGPWTSPGACRRWVFFTGARLLAMDPSGWVFFGLWCPAAVALDLLVLAGGVAAGAFGFPQSTRCHSQSNCRCHHRGGGQVIPTAHGGIYGVLNQNRGHVFEEMQRPDPLEPGSQAPLCLRFVGGRA